MKLTDELKDAYSPDVTELWVSQERDLRAGLKFEISEVTSELLVAEMYPIIEYVLQERAGKVALEWLKEEVAVEIHPSMRVEVYIKEIGSVVARYCLSELVDNFKELGCDNQEDLNARLKEELLHLAEGL